MAIDGRLGLVHLADNNASTPDEGVNNYGAATAADIHEPSSDIAGTGPTHGHEVIPDTSPIDIDPGPVTDMCSSQSLCRRPIHQLSVVAGVSTHYRIC